MNEHTYNGLIRTYAGACLVEKTKEDHIEAYLEDGWQLLK